MYGCLIIFVYIFISNLINTSDVSCIPRTQIFLKIYIYLCIFPHILSLASHPEVSYTQKFMLITPLFFFNIFYHWNIKRLNKYIEKFFLFFNLLMGVQFYTNILM